MERATALLSQAIFYWSTYCRYFEPDSASKGFSDEFDLIALGETG
jgi:hypothetical protein